MPPLLLVPALRVGVALLLQAQLSTDTVHRDGARDRARVTAAQLASAFRDTVARDLLSRARAARLAQDSSIVSYDATARFRLTAGLGFTRIGRDRIVFRSEGVARVRWHRDAGAWIDVQGYRTAAANIPHLREGLEDAHYEMRERLAVPYFPGHEPLFIGSGFARARVSERELVHPIAEGSERFYRYEAGDSMSFRLPDGHEVRLRELRVRPRRPDWNVAVGSLWFDVASGQLVRAAYRLSVPADLWALADEFSDGGTDDVPKAARAMMQPMKAEVTAIAVEYGLYEGRYWLPRLQTVELKGQASFARVPVKMEQSFRYASVNRLTRESMPAVRRQRSALEERLATLPDSEMLKLRDSLRVADRARRDSVRAGLIRPRRVPGQCDTSATRVQRRTTFGNDDAPGVRVAFAIPCDESTLARSPELKASIWDAGDEIFGDRETQALLGEALKLAAQPSLLGGGGGARDGDEDETKRPPAKLTYGLELLRYNRVEGLSAGAQLEQPLGAGLTARLLGRIGVADREPNAELALERSNLATSVRVAGYNRLVSANDWGRPLSFGSSIPALLFGRDEGFYYRASGAELAGAREPRSIGAHVEWRLFAEQQRAAPARVDWSLGASFIPNVDVEASGWTGASLRIAHTAGLDPRGVRLLSDVRLEGGRPTARRDALGDGYLRGAADLTLSAGLPFMFAGAVTAAGGSSAGELPAQRRWFLGGTQTVRGQRPDTTRSGDAFWLARAELGRDLHAAERGLGVVRPSLFGDIGWTGDRRALAEHRFGRPMSGAGVGVSLLDGLLRVDLARGVWPERRWRVDGYVEARF